MKGVLFGGIIIGAFYLDDTKMALFAIEREGRYLIIKFDREYVGCSEDYIIKSTLESTRDAYKTRKNIWIKIVYLEKTYLNKYYD